MTNPERSPQIQKEALAAGVFLKISQNSLEDTCARVSFLIKLLVTNLDKVVTYCEELQLINSDDPSMSVSCEVTWQIKCIIYQLAEDPWTPN